MGNTKYRIQKQTEENELFWQKHISAYQISGVSKIAYCSKNQVDYARFIYWSRKKPSPDSTPSLIAVNLATETSIPPNTTSLCTLRLKNGCYLQIHDLCVLSVILDKLV